MYDSNKILTDINSRSNFISVDWNGGDAMKYYFVQSVRLHNARIRLQDPFYGLYKLLDFYLGDYWAWSNIYNIFMDEGVEND